MGQFNILWAVFGAMALLLVWQQVYHMMEVRRLTGEIKDLYNRLMASGLQEYTAATKALERKPKKTKGADVEMTEAEKEQIIDRIPVN